MTLLPECPADSASTSEWVGYGELRAGAMFGEELSGYFALSRDVINAAGQLVERVSDRPGEPKAIHVAALLLARITTELAACVQLLRLGYAAQAITLVGTMLELTHVLAFMADDESRAAEWAAWDKPTRTYPGPLLETIKATSLAFGGNEDAVRREYEIIYRQICQIKHGNTLALHLPNAAVLADYHCIVIGPLITNDFRRLGYAAIQWAIRYAILAETAFIRYHVTAESWDALYAQQTELSERHAALTAQLAARLSAKE